MNNTLAVWTLLRTIMKVIAIVLFQRTKYFMQNILCTELCGQIEEWNAVTVYGIQFWFRSITKKQHCYMLLYWVFCNLLASFGEVVPYMLALLKIDNLDVNNKHLYLYYLIKLCPIPLVCCWWAFLCFGYSEFSTRLYYLYFTSYSPSVFAVMILHS